MNIKNNINLEETEEISREDKIKEKVSIAFITAVLLFFFIKILFL